MSQTRRKSIIQQIYDGELFPPGGVLSGSPAYREACGRAHTESAYLMSRLDDEDKRRLNELIDITGEMDSLTADANFAFGFRFGALLMLELLTDEIP